MNDEHKQYLREHAAIAAMQGFISTMNNTEILNSFNRVSSEHNISTCEFVAQSAVNYADALVEGLYPTKKAPAPEQKYETAVGGVVVVDGRRYVCKDAQGKDCEACAFHIKDSADCYKPSKLGACAADYRKDETDVLFELEEEQ